LNKTTLVLCIHNHQPVGNLPGVFEHAYRSAYLPFLEAAERFPDVKLVLHNTGPLLEWYEANAPDYIDRVAALVERGQVEVLTGGFYEPILSAIPERDALGQIEMMSDYVVRRFGARPRGMWLAERVWEPHLAKTIGEADVEYLPLDDYEFRLAGLDDEELVGSFVTEHEGVPVRVFPISKKLRYSIPFAEPEAAMAVLRSLAERGPGLTAVFGDDGEKFGVWPGTHAHVYGGGWLERFLRALSDSAEWLRTATFSEVVDEVPPVGRVYLPASSYPEMMEWALPTPARRQYEDFVRRLADEGLEEEWGPFVSGGMWKGFLRKYEESNLMTRKMMRVSRKVARAERAGRVLRELEDLPGVERAAGTGPAAVDPEVLREARRELWMGQCNCAYWHGIFGGLYLPHLRSAVYEHLIRSETLVESTRGRHWACAEVADHDVDGRNEVLLESDWANVYVAPSRGGRIIELDLKRAAWNVAGTMAPYEEAYHRQKDVRAGERGGGEEAGSGGAGENGNGTTRSIHDGVVVKEKGLESLMGRARGPMFSAVDHLLSPGPTMADLQSGAADLAEAGGGARVFEVCHSDDSVGVSTSGTLPPGRHPGVSAVVEKSISIGRVKVVRVEHRVTPNGASEALFATEWNFAFLTGDPEWVSAELPGDERFGLRRRRSIEAVESLSFVDRIRGERLSIALSPPAHVWTMPIETASQSENGLERVFQGVTMFASWKLRSEGQQGPFVLELRCTALEPDERGGSGGGKETRDV
jgi:hypothetical protein